MKTSKAIILSVFASIMLCASTSFALPLTLTATGLGVAAGTYGPDYVVNSDLTLHAITRIGQTGDYVNAYDPDPNHDGVITDDELIYNDGSGIAGHVYIATGTDGIGVQGEGLKADGSGDGSPKISGEKKHQDEALEFQFSSEVDPDSIVLGLNYISFSDDDVTLIIEVFGDDDVNIPKLSIMTNFNWLDSPDDQMGTLAFSDLGELDWLDSLSKFTVRAVDGHFYVNSIDYNPTPAVPEPGTMLLLGSGLLGLIGFRKKS